MRPAYGIAALALVACLLPARLPAQSAAPTPQGRSAPCDVEGVWELVAVSHDGKDQPLGGYRQRKIVARGHYMWFGADARRDTLPLRTALDSLRMMQVAGGTGSYTLSGDRYVERLDYFVAPAMEGQAFAATCRTEGDRWYHRYPMNPDQPAAADGTRPMAIEVWRRIR